MRHHAAQLHAAVVQDPPHFHQPRVVGPESRAMAVAVDLDQGRERVVPLRGAVHHRPRLPARIEPHGQGAAGTAPTPDPPRATPRAAPHITDDTPPHRPPVPPSPPPYPT